MKRNRTSPVVIPSVSVGISIRENSFFLRLPRRFTPRNDTFQPHPSRSSPQNLNRTAKLHAFLSRHKINRTPSRLTSSHTMPQAIRWRHNKRRRPVLMKRACRYNSCPVPLVLSHTNEPEPQGLCFV